MEKAIELAVILPENAEAKSGASETTEDSSKVATEDESALITVVTPESQPSIKHTKPHSIWTGNTCALCYYKGYPLITIGPHWPLFICLNSTVLIIAYVCLYFVISKVSYVGTVIGIILLTCQVASYSLTSLINPGTPVPELIEAEKLEQIKDSRALYCKICGIVRKRGQNVVHCDECDVCVEGYDHHCPWTGKCIGKGNICFFYAFLATTALFFMYILFAATLCTYGLG